MLVIRGNLVEAPLRLESASGRVGVGLVIAENHQYFDRDKGSWEQEEPVFWRGAYWGKAAENILGLVKGDRVVVVGRARANVWEDEDGTKRRATQFQADEVAVSAMYGSVTVERKPRNAEPVPAPAGEPAVAPF